MYSLTWPCNLLTDNHIWLYSGCNSNDLPSDDLLCQCGRIRFGEARRLALESLQQAEARRQEEREREARFWTVMDDNE